jgi:hypothetical protein
MEIKALGSRRPKNNWKKRARRAQRQKEAQERQEKYDNLKSKGDANGHANKTRS